MRNRFRTETENRPLIPIKVVDKGMVPANTLSEHQPPHKAMLYCPTCNHESLINGDWIIHIHTNYLDYECPSCGATIESRPNGPNVITPT